MARGRHEDLSNVFPKHDGVMRPGFVVTPLRRLDEQNKNIAATLRAAVSTSTLPYLELKAVFIVEYPGPYSLPR